MQNLIVSSELYYESDNSYEFEENFKHIKGDSYLYIDYSNLSGDFYESDFFTLKPRQITKLKKLILNDEYFSYCQGDLKGLTQNDLYQILFDNNLSYHDLDELEQFYNDNNLAYVKNYISMFVIGHSQGDKAQILICKDEFKKMAGVDFNADIYQNEFTNIFYNSQIIGDINITFNHLDKNYKFNISYCEFCNDRYELDLDLDNLTSYINKQLHIKLSSVDMNILTTELNKLDYNSVSYY